MSTNNDRQATHNMVDHIFHDLLPARGMAERPEQTALSHLMLNALLDGSIALCDAGTGIGKTYAYLVAGVAFLRSLTANGLLPLCQKKKSGREGPILCGSYSPCHHIPKGL